jgi:hypothetical protein
VLRRLTELAGALSLATDLAHGVPPEHQLRVAVRCSRVAAELDLEDARPPGCLAGALRSGPGLLFGSTCEAAADLAGRLGYSAEVVGALSVAFERFDGKGWLGKFVGDTIPVAARIAMAAEDIVTVAEFAGPETAERELGKRAGRQHDPAVVTALQRVHRATYGDFDSGDAWDLLATADPRPDRCIADDEIEDSADRERVRLAPYHTERIWSHSAWLAPIGAVASQHAERLDGSGYHRGLAGSALAREARGCRPRNATGPWSRSDRSDRLTHHDERLNCFARPPPRGDSTP